MSNSQGSRRQGSMGAGLTGLCLLLATVSSSTAAANWWDKLFGEDKATDTAVAALTSGEISEAFKEALSLGVDKVAVQLAKPDGFNGDQQIHIPLPAEFKQAKKLLDKVGYGEVLDDLELKLNRAAEAATPQAKELFVDAINQLTFEDVQGIYKGGDNAATAYFREKMTPQLAEVMQPVIADSLSDVGAVQLYDQLLAKYKDIPFAPDLKANLTDHVIDRGLSGLFHYIGQEEAAIRKDPLKQGSALLKKVFMQGQ